MDLCFVVTGHSITRHQPSIRGPVARVRAGPFPHARGSPECHGAKEIVWWGRRRVVNRSTRACSAAVLVAGREPMGTGDNESSLRI
ncbi:MAG: hypothetical protein ACE5HU_03735 [Acidobacteriota bacterium]